MGRELKRVPLDFDWPQGKIWPGYMVSISSLIEDYYPKLSNGEQRTLVLHFARLMKCEIEEDRNTPYVSKWNFLEVPSGEGYQLWETTSEGTPQSPVFATLDELCAWCETNATTFADYRASAAEWKKMLDDGMVYHQEGNAIFL